MTDEELIESLRLWNNRDDAADRIEALIAENERLGQQCVGLMQAGMNNGQALILAEAKNAQLREALGLLDKAAGAVTRMGAVTGPQWTRLSIALLQGRAALKPAPTVTAGWPTEEGEGSIIVGNVKGDSHD